MVKGRGPVVLKNHYRLCRPTVCQAGEGSVANKLGPCQDRGPHTMSRTDTNPIEIRGPKCAWGWGGKESACQERSNPF